MLKLNLDIIGESIDGLWNAFWRAGIKAISQGHAKDKFFGDRKIQRTLITDPVIGDILKQWLYISSIDKSNFIFRQERKTEIAAKPVILVHQYRFDEIFFFIHIREAKIKSSLIQFCE